MKNFSKCLTALRETAEEKAQFDSQVDLLAEETIYKNLHLKRYSFISKNGTQPPGKIINIIR